MVVEKSVLLIMKNILSVRRERSCGRAEAPACLESRPCQSRCGTKCEPREPRRTAAHTRAGVKGAGGHGGTSRQPAKTYRGHDLVLIVGRAGMKTSQRGRHGPTGSRREARGPAGRRVEDEERDANGHRPSQVCQERGLPHVQQ
jgi:hypothetical protein